MITTQVWPVRTAPLFGMSVLFGGNALRFAVDGLPQNDPSAGPLASGRARVTTGVVRLAGHDASPAGRVAQH
jgi:hypothetical protein